jgi:hypothetical protein
MEGGESALGGLAVGNGRDVGLHIVLAALENSSIAGCKVQQGGGKKADGDGGDARDLAAHCVLVMRGGRCGRWRALGALGITGGRLRQAWLGWLGGRVEGEIQGGFYTRTPEHQYHQGCRLALLAKQPFVVASYGKQLSGGA